MSASGISDSIREHSRFFDRLVNLVPARFYHAEENAQQSLKYMKKNVREEEKSKRKQQAKAAKRAKLNPETAQTALDVQQKGLIKPAEAGAESNEQEEADSPEEEKEAKPKDQTITQTKKELLINGRSGTHASMDELRVKLQNKLQVLREKRKAEERVKHAEEALKWREKSLRGKKDMGSKSSRKRKGSDTSQGGPAKQSQLEAPEPAANLTFGQLTFGQEEERHRKRQKKPTKAELLQEAERKAAEKQQLAASAEGQARLGMNAMASSLSRAKGEKILDDPKLLRKSMKKEQKEKEKKSAAWKERQQRQKKEGRDKQKKRRENLQARVTAKQQKKKQLREKKLMRPGFEGRRDSFINEANP